MSRSLKQMFLLCWFGLGLALPHTFAQQQDTAADAYEDYEQEDYDVAPAEEETEEQSALRFSEISTPLPFKDRAVDAGKWQQLSAGDAFVYTDNPPEQQKQQESDSGFLKFLESLFNFFSSGAGKAIIWIVVALLVLLIIFRIFKLNGNILFARKDKKMGGPQDESADDFIPENWEQTIAEAARAGNYRLAVRHSYRYLLSLLNEKELIRFETAKTNYQYVYELSGTPWHQPFVRLTRQYEYAWYGGFDIDREQFEAYTRLLQETRQGLR